MDEGSEEDADDLDRWERLAELFTAVSHKVRIAILASLYADEERPLTEVGDAFDYSRSAIQKHVDTLVEVDAVYRPQDDDRAYALTPLGRYLAKLVVEDGDELYTAIRRVSEAADDAVEEFSDVPLDESSMEKAVNNRKWELVGTELEAELSALFPASGESDDRP
ncbi:helix-turn-helix transcriptional regulator [Haloterrigena sp. SYSU A558-1]|uniref:Helix-turn-helix transcriptional regulator n=1 Tax=Haloterrigena gelatinilytica TaxID=2741724 RepID=A0ABX2LLW0_9EURY|nr:helix-turn-helix domain-containing protein [Haloterrigena gelatinilytica]NUC74781.1 helix-turn-helix transcriptional regulator [Haloterrigena gelatinilytica]